MIFRFDPILKSVLWGGEKLKAYKGLATDQTQIGESWELSDVPGRESVVADGPHAGKTLHQLAVEQGAALLGEAAWQALLAEGAGTWRFPILVKFIDAQRDLSIQVHPDDRLARQRHQCPGKTEMWYALDGCEPSAHLRIGLRRAITPAEYLQLVAEHRLTDVLCDVPCRAGDIFYLPAGRIHAICGGTMVAEIQQTSDVTYRIYDYDRRDADGRLRQLHTAESLEAINFADVQDDYRTRYDAAARNRRAEAVSCPYFRTSVIRADSPLTLDYRATDSFVILVCTAGTLRIDLHDAGPEGVTSEQALIHQGQTVLLPASTLTATLVPDGVATLLEVTQG